MPRFSTFRCLAGILAVAASAATLAAVAVPAPAPAAGAPSLKPETLHVLEKLGIEIPGATDDADLGGAAAPLSVAKWIKNEPKADALKGHIRVVEFWATWCGPCRETIPHLTALQQRVKDKGVQVIGVSSEAEAATVESFVKGMGDKMDYAVALDKDRKTGADYMEKFGVNGIPHAFVVDKDDKLVWHGHPLDGLDQVVDKLIDGKFSLEEARKAAAAAKYQQLTGMIATAYLRIVVMGNGGDKANPDWPKPEEILNAVVAIGVETKSYDILDRLAQLILKNSQVAEEKRDPKAALKLAQAALQAGGEDTPSIHATVARAMALSGDRDGAAKEVKKAIELAKAAGDDKLAARIQADADDFNSTASAGKKKESAKP